jgi:hypothetical protein
MSEPAVRVGWRAFAWLGALNLTGVVITLGALRSLCIYCERSTSGGATLAVWIGVAVLAAAPIMAARSCGRRQWLAAGILAFLAAPPGSRSASTCSATSTRHSFSGSPSRAPSPCACRCRKPWSHAPP